MLFASTAELCPVPTSRQILVFASGVNRITEMRGFARLALPFGVSASELSAAAVKYLLTLNAPLLIDSGAFSEIEFTPTGSRVVRPISDREWRRRLDVYKRLAASLGVNAYVVAPDRVGDQRETLRRLDRYRPQMQEIAALGATVLIPLQVGEMTHAAFYRATNAAAGFDMVPAMPMKKEATDTNDLLTFVREVRPRQIHLLGLGATQRRGKTLVKAIHNFVPDALVSMDSNRLRAVIGKNRPLTLAEHQMRSADVEGIYGEVCSPVLDKSGDRLDYTDLISCPSYWATDEMLTAIAAWLPSAEARRAFRSDPDGFLQSVSDDGETAWIETPMIGNELDRQWSLYVASTISQSVRTAAIVDVFGGARSA